MVLLRPLNRWLPIGAGLRLLSLWQAIYEGTGGRVGARFGPWRMLLLRTRGRRTGKLRSAALLYLEDAGGYVVFGSRSGSDRPPAWFLNLQADPQVEVQLGRRTELVRARVVEGAERERLWRRVNELWPYDSYQARTPRRIPVIKLEPDD